MQWERGFILSFPTVCISVQQEFHILFTFSIDWTISQSGTTIFTCLTTLVGVYKKFISHTHKHTHTLTQLTPYTQSQTLRRFSTVFLSSLCHSLFFSFLNIRYKTVGLGSFKSGLAVSEPFEVNCSKESIYPLQHHHHHHLLSPL